MKPIKLNNQREVNLTNTIPITGHMLDYVLQLCNHPKTLMICSNNNGYAHIYEGDTITTSYQLVDIE